jgi:carbamoyl-phosphate synthase large subunit
VAVEADENPPIAKICKVVKTVPTDILCIPLMDKLCYELAGLPNIITSPKETNQYSYDKVKFETEWDKEKFYPIPFKEQDIKHIFKPRYGYGSKGLEIGKYYDLINYKKSGSGIVQRLIKGQEYTVDCYFDKYHNLVGSVPRKRIRVADGEVVDALIEKKPAIQDICNYITLHYDFIGPVNFQFIEEEGTGIPYLTEINARFGGGCILSLEAGFDMIDMIKREYFTNQPLPEYPIKYGLMMRRVYRETFFST